MITGPAPVFIWNDRIEVALQPTSTGKARMSLINRHLIRFDSPSAEHGHTSMLETFWKHGRLEPASLCARRSGGNLAIAGDGFPLTYCKSRHPNLKPRFSDHDWQEGKSSSHEAIKLCTGTQTDISYTPSAVCSLQWERPGLRFLMILEGD